MIENYKNTKWAEKLLESQKEDGSWGYFHTLSMPAGGQVTTEQALRRLMILGFDIRDSAIEKAVAYMSDCLSGKKQLPDRREKTHDWDLFTDLMLSTWIRKFTLLDEHANRIAGQWTKLLTRAFSEGEFSSESYAAGFFDLFGKKLYGDRFLDFVSFYQVSLLAGTLDIKTENLLVDYILSHKSGIYYVYGKPLDSQHLPVVFSGKEASHYIGAMELLADYRNSLSQLKFVADWLNANRNENGAWDLGSHANDKVYFPLSDNWRKRADREADCTWRIQRLLDRLSDTF